MVISYTHFTNPRSPYHSCILYKLAPSHHSSPQSALTLLKSSSSSSQLCSDQAGSISGIMKLRVAVVLCVVLLVASDMTSSATAAGCDIYQLLPCMGASKNAAMMPSKQCCTNVAKMGQGSAGAKCLCSLLSSSLARAQGVVPRIALGIPQKCRIAVPKGFVCQGIRVPGS